MVDRAHVDRRAQAALLRDAASEAGHAAHAYLDSIYCVADEFASVALVSLETRPNRLP